MNELKIPHNATPGSYEILRVWVSDQGQFFSLRSGVWEDPAAWGLILADLARHIAGAYESDKRFDPKAVLKRIKEGLDAELTD